VLEARLLLRVKRRATTELKSLRLGAALWRWVAVYCRVRRALGGTGRRLWTARLGYALMRLDRHDEATAAYAAAITGDPAAASWTEIVRRVEAEVDQNAVVPAPDGRTEPLPNWFHHLGLSLREQGELEAAVTLVEYACQRDTGKSRWLDRLAHLHEHLGNLDAAADARMRLIELQGDDDPAPRLALATLYDRAGQWDLAAQVLNYNTAKHPGHTPSLELLARVSTSMALWGGTFTGMLTDRTGGRFTLAAPGLDDADATHSAKARSALERAIALDPTKPKRRAALADACLAQGDLASAIEHYQAVVDKADTSTSRWALGAKQRWQFQLERCHHRLGQPRVSDPLFTAELTPSGSPATVPEELPGLFNARFVYMGLQIHGFLAASKSDAVQVFLNGVLIRTVNVTRDSYLPGFNLMIKRATLDLFPAKGQFQVRTADGHLLYGPHGADRVDVSLPHGDGRLLDIITAGGALDKKGEIRPSAAEMRRRQNRDLEIYAGLREYFRDKLGRSVFLLYGTLLGYHRDGDFIPGDDDFDAGYVSDETDPTAVKDEAKNIIVDLVRAGFTVSFNRRGRLFRVQPGPSAQDAFHVDIHPIWFQDGNVWIHNLLSMPSTREDFLPAVEGMLRGTPVLAPRDTEVFLRGNYGPGWKVPDPGFKYYPSEVDPAVRRNLAKAFISVREYRELAERIERDVGGSPTAGRFVSIGSQNLYPLEQYIT
jgi:tetratricopeptide (TPR) repeat protein